MTARTDTGTGRKNIVFLEFLRIIACFLVIVNHTNSRIFLSTPPSGLWLCSLVYFFLSKPAIPVFLMISGYTMLDREDSYGKTAARFGRIVAGMAVFSCLYSLFYWLDGTVAVNSPGDFVALAVSFLTADSYWYLHLYLGIVLMLPFLQKMAANMKQQDFHVFFLISGLFLGIWPVLVHYVPSMEYSEHFILPVFNSYIAMLLWGCYFRRYIQSPGRGSILGLGLFVGMCLVNTGLTWLEYWNHPGTNYLFYDNRELLSVVLAAVGLFAFASGLRFGKRARGMVLRLGELTFGIYLVSDLLIVQLEPVYSGLVGFGVNPMAAMVVFELVVFFGGAAITLVLKKLPVLNKIL